jgi:hypothetical protein
MVPFLQDFLSNLSAVQSKQLLRLLGQMRDRGEIRNSVEFEARLTDLANLIKKGELTQRTPPLVYENGDLLESDAIRTFIENVRLDCEAALGETERLGNAIRAHNRVLTKNYFDAIEAGLSDLEAETRAYEVLENQRFTGFSSVVKKFSFDGAISAPGANRNEPASSSLFIDGRGGETLIYSPPGNGEAGLHLGISKDSIEHENMFDRIEVLTDSTTPQTTLDTSMAENTPIKAIDGSADTAWRHSVLLSENPDSVRLILAPSFIGARRVSAIVIHSVADVSMRLISATYTDSGGQERDLDIGVARSGSLFRRSRPLGSGGFRTGDWILPNTRRVVPVGDIVARRFSLTFQQDTGSDGDFFFFNTELGSWQKDTSIEDIIDDTTFVPWDGFEVPADLGFIDLPGSGQQQASFFEYVFGLKEISTIEREYGPNGFFVPELFEMSTAPNILALYTDIEYPVGDLSDIEVLLQKENYDVNSSLLDVETIPMLPYGTSSINERLFLAENQVVTSGNDTGLLRFYPDFSESITVYREGTALTLGTDYTVSVDGFTFSSVLPPLGTATDPPVCRIRITAPQSGVFYTVSYTPLLSSTAAGSEVWLNQDHTVRLGRYQTYVFNNQRPSGKVSHCRLGLQIIIRANTLDTRISPYLREIVLLGG